MGTGRAPASAAQAVTPAEYDERYRQGGWLSEVHWKYLTARALAAGVAGGVMTALLALAAASSPESFVASWLTGAVVPLGVLAWVAFRLAAAGKGEPKTPTRLPVSATTGALGVAFGAAALTALLESRREVDWAHLDLASMVPVGAFAGVAGGTVGAVISVIAVSISVCLLQEQRGRITLAGAHMLVAWLAGLPTLAAGVWVAAGFEQPLVVFPAVAMAVTGAVSAARRSLS